MIFMANLEAAVWQCRKEAETPTLLPVLTLIAMPFTKSALDQIACLKRRSQYDGEQYYTEESVTSLCVCVNLHDV